MTRNEVERLRQRSSAWGLVMDALCEGGQDWMQREVTLGECAVTEVRRLRKIEAAADALLDSYDRGCDGGKFASGIKRLRAALAKEPGK